MCSEATAAKEKLDLELNMRIVYQRLALEEARLVIPNHVPRKRLFFRLLHRKEKLSLEETMRALVQTRVHRTIWLLHDFIEEGAFGNTKNCTNTKIDLYIDSDASYHQLGKQIRWFQMLRDMPTLIESTPFKTFVQYIAENNNSGEELSLSTSPSYLSRGIEQYFEEDMEFRKLKAYQNLCHLIRSAHQIGKWDQFRDNVKKIRQELHQYLLKRFDIKTSSDAVQTIVNYYIHARIGYLFEHPNPSDHLIG